MDKLPPTNGHENISAWDVVKHDLINTIKEKEEGSTSFSSALGAELDYYEENSARIRHVLQAVSGKNCSTKSKEVAILLENSRNLVDFIMLYGLVVSERTEKVLKTRVMLDFFKEIAGSLK